MRMHLAWVRNDAFGYGRYGVRLEEALRAEGVEIDATLPFLGLNKEATPTCEVAAWVGQPTHVRGWFKDQYTVISSMWEAQRLPEAYRENMHCFDLVVVPSEQNLELYSRYHPNVKKVHLGVGPEWAFRQRQEPREQFRFLIAGSGIRKGQDIAYKAFQAAFLPGRHEGPVPTLTFKTPRMVPYSGPNVEVVSGFLKGQAEIDLYASSHCYLGPSRGEGWGLQPLQAIAQGMPTILTNAHGQAEYAHLGYGLSTTSAKAEYFVFGDAGMWWEPNFDELVDYMRFVYNNYEAACSDARQASVVAHREFSWQRCAQAFIEAIGRERLGPYTGDGSWVDTTPMLYEIKVLRPYDFNVAGREYQMVPGETYAETADIKRILWEFGLSGDPILDPACVAGDDSGLHPDQLEGLALYSASTKHCHTCGQVLNSQPLWERPEDDLVPMGATQ